MADQGDFDEFIGNKAAFIPRFSARNGRPRRAIKGEYLTVLTYSSGREAPGGRRPGRHRRGWLYGVSPGM
jgi:hypothetical protein